VAHPAQKIFGTGKTFDSGEQQYSVWEAASQSTKRLDLLKIEGHAPRAPLATSMQKAAV